MALNAPHHKLLGRMQLSPAFTHHPEQKLSLSSCCYCTCTLYRACLGVVRHDCNAFTERSEQLYAHVYTATRVWCPCGSEHVAEQLSNDLPTANTAAYSVVMPGRSYTAESAYMLHGLRPPMICLPEIHPPRVLCLHHSWHPVTAAHLPCTA